MSTITEHLDPPTIAYPPRSEWVAAVTAGRTDASFWLWQAQTAASTYTHPFAGRATINPNALLCPRCADLDARYTIHGVSTEIILTDQGVDQYSGAEWDDGCLMECRSCEYTGQVFTFAVGEPAWVPAEDGSASLTVPPRARSSESWTLTATPTGQWSITHDPGDQPPTTRTGGDPGEETSDLLAEAQGAVVDEWRRSLGVWV